jgi:hypothetical protein
LLTIILNPDPEKRATIDDIRNSAWYRGITLEQLEAEEAEAEARRKRTEASNAAAEAGAQQLSNSQPSGDGSSSSPGEAITWIDGSKRTTGLTPSTGPNEDPDNSGMSKLTLEVTRVHSLGTPGNGSTPLPSPGSQASGNLLLTPVNGSTPSGLSPGLSPSLPGLTAGGGAPSVH